MGKTHYFNGHFRYVRHNQRLIPRSNGQTPKPSLCPKLQELLKKLNSVASVVSIYAPHALPYDPSLRGWCHSFSLTSADLGGRSWGYHGSRWWMLSSGYVKIAIEPGHRNSGFTHWTCWFSIGFWWTFTRLGTTSDGPSWLCRFTMSSPRRPSIYRLAFKHQP